VLDDHALPTLNPIRRLCVEPSTTPSIPTSGVLDVGQRDDAHGFFRRGAADAEVRRLHAPDDQRCAWALEEAVDDLAPRHIGEESGRIRLVQEIEQPLDASCTGLGSYFDTARDRQYVCRLVNARKMRRSAIFLRRMIGSMFMRVSSRCAHQLRPPPGLLAGVRRLGVGGDGVLLRIVVLALERVLEDGDPRLSGQAGGRIRKPISS
jgi:hypothetical protein